MKLNEVCEVIIHVLRAAPTWQIRELDALHADGFCNLRELTLDGNLLTDTRAIPRLPALTVLRLNHNMISSAGGAEVTADGRQKEKRGLAALAALEVLQLGYNQVTDVPGLRLHYLHNLKASRATTRPP